jgi:recombination protein RecT
MGAIQTTTNGQVVRSEKKEKTLYDVVRDMGPALAEALPKHVSKERLSRVAITALRQNPALLATTPASFFGCMMTAAQLGLEVNSPLGQAYLIPRKNGKTGKTDCTMIIGYQGFQDLARRTGEIADIYAEAVYPGDIFEYELGLERKLRHVPAGEEHKDTELTHVYAVVKLKSGATSFVVLRKSQVEKYRKRGASGAGVKTPWDSDYEKMAKKTAFRQLFAWIPKSAEMVTAMTLDEAPEIGKSQISVIDPNITEAMAAQGIDVTPEPEVVEAESAMRQPGEDDE